MNDLLLYGLAVVGVWVEWLQGCPKTLKRSKSGEKHAHRRFSVKSTFSIENELRSMKKTLFAINLYENVNSCDKTGTARISKNERFFHFDKKTILKRF